MQDIEDSFSADAALCSGQSRVAGAQKCGCELLAVVLNRNTGGVAMVVVLKRCLRGLDEGDWIEVPIRC